MVCVHFTQHIAVLYLALPSAQNSDSRLLRYNQVAALIVCCRIHNSDATRVWMARFLRPKDPQNCRLRFSTAKISGVLSNCMLSANRFHWFPSKFATFSSEEQTRSSTTNIVQRIRQYGFTRLYYEPTLVCAVHRTFGRWSEYCYRYYDHGYSKRIMGTRSYVADAMRHWPLTPDLDACF